MPVRINIPVLSRTPISWLSLLAALAAGSAATVAMLAAKRPISASLLYSALAAGAVLWTATALRVLASRDQQRARTRNANQDHFNRTVWSRLTHERRVTNILLCERTLPAIEARLTAAARAMQDYTDPVGDLAEWREAAGAWLEMVAPVVPDIAGDIVPPDAVAQRRARKALPASRNLSSADLKAATAFLIESAQLDAARQRFSRRRDTVLTDYFANAARPE